MKTGELLSSLDEPAVVGCCELEEVTEDEECPYDDDDFWEALDLIQTCRKAIMNVMRDVEEVPEARRRLLNNLCDDLGQFTSLFLEEE